MKSLHAQHVDDGYVRLVETRRRMLEGSLERAAAYLDPSSPSRLIIGYWSATRALEVQLEAHSRGTGPPLERKIDDSLAFCASQQAWFWWRSIRLTKALVAPRDELNAHVHTLEKEDSGYLSIQAELVARRLSDLDTKSLEIVRAEAILRPERWRWALRQLFAYEGARQGDIRRAAELMELVGNAEDIGLLRSLARNKNLTIPDAGRALAKRLAPRAYVHDLGRVAVEIGDRVVVGAEIRKKVLSLLVFLLTRPQMTATREQVMDALWPEMEPQAAANSLNQTAYFLRQLFEPKTDDDSTGGYLNSKADLMWLDPELVRGRSAECLELIAATRRDPSPELVGQLAEKYTGRFAADFTYDEWASAFRDNMHAGYLDRVQRSIEMDTKAGFFDRAIGIAQLALAADPEAEQIELQLLRLYRLTGAHAAAAEQYAHYSAVMREQLGVEPPPLEAI
jgi:DNA-binding SARP family transcriptional activator